MTDSSNKLHFNLICVTAVVLNCDVGAIRNCEIRAEIFKMRKQSQKFSAKSQTFNQSVHTTYSHYSMHLSKNGIYTFSEIDLN